MENSQAYKYLTEQVKATGSKKMDGYYPKILEEIFDWEREEVEDIIWDNFVNKNDSDLSIFLPKLNAYNGVEALKSKLEMCRIPSGNSVNIAKVLYEYTGDVYYLNVIRENIEKSTDKGPYVAMLSYVNPSPHLYELLVEMYVNSDDELVRAHAVRGILVNKQYIIDPHRFEEFIAAREVRKHFDKEGKAERAAVIKQLEAGEFDHYKNHEKE